MFAQIHSLPEGGLWSANSTWVGGVVPGAANNVVINGAVYVNNNSCRDLQITIYGSIISVNTANGILSIFGNLNNQGVMTNNLSGNPLSIYSLGNIINSGTISCQNFYLNGTTDQNFSNTGSFSPTYLTDNNVSSGLVAQTDLIFSNVMIDLNNAPFVLNPGGGPGRWVTLQGGYLQRAIIQGGNGATLNADASSLIRNISANELIFTGIVNIGVSVSIGVCVNNGILRTSNLGNYTLAVLNRLDNYGTIRNNPSGNPFYINLSGHLNNYGFIENNSICLQATTTQSIYQSPTAADINLQHFYSSTATGDIQLLSNLRFSGCAIDLQNRPLIMYSGQNTYNLDVIGGYLYRCVMVTNGYSGLNMNNGAYLRNVTAGDLILQGTVMIYQFVTMNNVINQGVLTCVTQMNVTINGNLYNNGTIENRLGAHLFMVYLQGNLYNYGTISNYCIYFTSPTGQSIYQSAAAQPFSNAYWDANYGNLTLLSDLRFSNCYVDLYNYSFIMYSSGINYNISVNGGRLYRCGLITNGYSALTLNNNAFLFNVNGQNLILQGTVDVHLGVYFNNVINYGILQQRASQYITMTVYQGFYNHGTVRNNPVGGYLYLNCQGDFLNDGTVNNYSVSINGNSNQNLYVTGTVNPSYFYLVANLGGFNRWYLDGNPTIYTAATLAINPYTSYGVWQPMGSIPGRLITISLPVILSVPANVSLVIAGDSHKLSWNQVVGALYYIVHASYLPDGPYYSLPGYVYDTNLADGIVETFIAPTEPKKFYRITAAY